MFTSSAFVYRSNYIFPLPQQDNATEHRAFTLLSLILIFSSKFQRKERLNVGKFSCVLIDWLIDRWFLAFCFLKDIFLIHSDTFIKIYASVTKNFNVFSGKLNQKDEKSRLTQLWNWTGATEQQRPWLYYRSRSEKNKLYQTSVLSVFLKIPEMYDCWNIGNWCFKNPGVSWFFFFFFRRISFPQVKNIQIWILILFFFFFQKIQEIDNNIYVNFPCS